jgi:hypothetical protein
MKQDCRRNLPRLETIWKKSGGQMNKESNKRRMMKIREERPKVKILNPVLIKTS